MLIRYTTPTVQFTFSDIDVTEITESYLIIKQGGKVIIERDLTTADVVHTAQANYLAWTLTQAETASLTKSFTAQIYCDWKLQDGTRGRSATKSATVQESGKLEVI